MSLSKLDVMALLKLEAIKLEFLDIASIFGLGFKSKFEAFDYVLSKFFYLRYGGSIEGILLGIIFAPELTGTITKDEIIPAIGSYEKYSSGLYNEFVYLSDELMFLLYVIFEEREDLLLFENRILNNYSYFMNCLLYFLSRLILLPLPLIFFVHRLGSIVLRKIVFGLLYLVRVFKLVQLQIWRFEWYLYVIFYLRLVDGFFSKSISIVVNILNWLIDIVVWIGKVLNTIQKSWVKFMSE